MDDGQAVPPGGTAQLPLEQILATIITNSNLSTEGIRVISAKLTPTARVADATSALLIRPSHASTGAFLAALPREELIRTLRDVRRMTAGSSATTAAQRERSYADMQKRFDLTSVEMATINGEGEN